MVPKGTIDHYVFFLHIIFSYLNVPFSKLLLYKKRLSVEQTLGVLYTVLSLLSLLFIPLEVRFIKINILYNQQVLEEHTC